MEHRQSYSIKDVSELMQIPKATIRYWEDMGLITLNRNDDNAYREFSLSNFMELSNISFFRGLDIPIKELKEILVSDVSVQEDFLLDAERNVKEQMEELKQKLVRIRMQKYLLSEITRLKEHGLTFGTPCFSRMVLFNEDNKEHWRGMIEEPHVFTLLMNCENAKEYSYGIGYTKEQTQQIGETMDVIWEQRDGTYLECLMTVNFLDESKNNMEQLMYDVKQMGYHAVSAAGQYLASGQTGDLTDYYKLWIEVE